MRGADVAFAAGCIEGQPLAVSPYFRPHVEGHDRAFETLHGIHQADGSTCRHAGGAAQGGGQHAVLTAIAAELPGDISGGAEVPAETDLHIVVHPLLNKPGLGPGIHLVAYRVPGQPLDHGIIAVDPEATLEVFRLRLAGIINGTRTVACLHMKVKGRAFNVPALLTLILRKGCAWIIVALDRDTIDGGTG